MAHESPRARGTSPTVLTVFFDLDGTLVETTEPFSAVFARVLRSLGFERQPEQVEVALRDCWPWYEAEVGRHRDAELEFWRRFNSRVCAALDTGERAREAGHAVTDAFRSLDATRLYEDALPCLDRLAAEGHTLGVLTARPDARRVLEPLGVVDRFSYLVDAFRSGSAKQDRRSFQCALDLAGIDPGEAIHVGDVYERDVVPARAAGLTPVLIDRTRSHPQNDCLRVHTLTELPPLIQDLGSELRI
jgi:putative hydrolase of the HAD superfamily